MISTLVVLGIIAAIVFWGISIYNGLVATRQRVSQAFADIDVQLKQRHDLIPNLIETVKGYVTHERETLDAVVKARNSAIAAQGPAAQGQAEAALSGALRQLFALSEAYPDLKASSNFQQLQTELADIENKIAAARRFFNNAVQEYTIVPDLLAEPRGTETILIVEDETATRRALGESLRQLAY